MGVCLKRCKLQDYKSTSDMLVNTDVTFLFMLPYLSLAPELYLILVVLSQTKQTVLQKKELL